jgi:ATP-binding cassette subfamily B protein/subfamily B ATP-binding cassette protein MsbA
MLDQRPTIRDPAQPRNLPTRVNRLVFDQVGFHYVPGVPVLKQIDMTVKAGETIAIVGPNGCGKSTLIQLIPRFFDPIEGSVRLDDVDVRDARLSELRNRIGLVTQQSVLFDDSVYQNILCGRLDASEAEVIQAAQRARAHRFIVDRLSHGYQTIVGAGGSRLSGGQRQRIALARAILRDPEILLLDEATSQIDLESEQLIYQALEEFARDRTVFMVTHRMSALALADRILVMNAGQIEDLGTHQELIRRCPLYQRLHALQFQQSA